MQMEMEDGHVWAAQYRLLDAKYLLGKSGELGNGEEHREMMKMSLYKDILSVNTRRGAGEEEGAEVGLSPETDEDQEDEAQEKAYAEYMQKLEDTIRIFEKAPPRLLSN